MTPAPSPRRPAPRTRARRLPWLSFLLAVGCYGGFLVADRQARAVRAEGQAALEQAAAHLLRHPYLSVPSALEAHLDAAVFDERRRAHAESLARRGGQRVPLPIQFHRQEQLDELLRAGRARLEALPAQRWGVRPARLEPRSVPGHVLVHTRSLHLLGNLLLLLALGVLLERAWGSPVFGLVSLLAACATAGGYALAGPGLERPLVGASGVVAGLTGAWLVEGWRIGGRAGGLALSLAALAWLALPFALETPWPLAEALEPGGPATGRALAAALAAGAASGLLAALSLVAVRAAAERRRGARSDTSLGAALAAYRAGRVERAFAMLERLAHRHPHDRDVALALWEVAREAGRPDRAAAAMRCAVREALRAGDRTAAARHWLELRAHGTGVGADPELLLALAESLREAGEREAALTALRDALEGPGASDAPDVATRVALAAAELHRPTAEEAAWRALGSAALPLEARQQLEALLTRFYPAGAELAELELEGRAAAPAPEPTDADATQQQLQPDATREPPDEDATQEQIDDGDTRRQLDPDATQEQPDADDTRVEVAAAPGPGPGATASEPTPPAPPPVPPRDVRVIDAVPLVLDRAGLVVEVEGVGRKRLGFERVEALGVAAVAGLRRRPVIVIDLLLNWRSPEREPLRVFRLRSDRFDPQRFVRSPSRTEAVRAFTMGLLRATGATPLPDPRSVRGDPFAAFPHLDGYQRAVLQTSEAQGGLPAPPAAT